MMVTRFVLASASKSRKAMLEAAGVGFEAVAPDIDEDAVKAALAAEDAAPARIAAGLAAKKAQAVSARFPDALVLGADQVLVFEESLFSKADNRSAARQALISLRGAKHELISAAALVRNGKSVWRHTETAALWMRDFSDMFLDSYLAAEGDDLLGSVGCYRIEGRGAQLFARVSGDQFVIRGLPLLQLLKALRDMKVLPP